MTDCIEWNKARTKAGYGCFRENGKLVYTHRRAMEKKLGRRLGPGEIVHHECENPPCMNPDHLTTKDQPLHAHEHNRQISDEDVEFIRKLRSEDHSYRDIEAITGWSHETARRWCIDTLGRQSKLKERPL